MVTESADSGSSQSTGELSKAKVLSEKKLNCSHSAVHHSAVHHSGEEQFFVYKCAERDSLGNPPCLQFCRISVPRNYREAKASDQWQYWEQAMCEEKDSLDTHETKEFVERPWGKKVIHVHWIYSVKVDEFGNVTRFKAMLGATTGEFVSSCRIIAMNTWP
jgi:hypothetical protein